MIVQLTGTLLDVRPSSVVLDVGGVGFELGVSSLTSAGISREPNARVTLLTRLVVREDAMELFGFSSREERALFDRLVGISGVGPRLALSVLSTFSPKELAQVVEAQDVARMSRVPGVGRKKAQRLLVELAGVFQRDVELRGLVATPSDDTAPDGKGGRESRVRQEAGEALLSMGFTPQEAELALEGHEEAGATSLEQVLAYALKRLGSGA